MILKLSLHEVLMRIYICHNLLLSIYHKVGGYLQPRGRRRDFVELKLQKQTNVWAILILLCVSRTPGHRNDRTRLVWLLADRMSERKSGMRLAVASGSGSVSLFVIYFLPPVSE